MKLGFTLIELLVVIAIIAILAVVVILTLNPAQLLAQARDSTRISDLSTLRTSLSLFQVDTPSIPVGTPATCYSSLPETVFWTPDQTGIWGATTTCAAWMVSTDNVATSATPSAIDSSGWVPVNFADISAGSPLGQEPIDPINTMGIGVTQLTGAFFYSFAAGVTSTFKLGAFLESAKYSNGGSGDAVSADGGTNNYVLEEGTDMGL